MTEIKINIDPKRIRISVWNNGPGHPHSDSSEGKNLRAYPYFRSSPAGSNFNDDEKKTTAVETDMGQAV
ncbi:hypothetical protein BV898_00845 [Hypsibius exemplaris]|uniref:Uncharacterized protein n=1 Tax=Hypsibius exemplaris TaxID=2072580 RepID=A0A1W0XCE8_HYPEX|nr:hypothetical protein BV898_00845 [Hypsibius exemplaris]